MSLTAAMALFAISQNPQSASPPAEPWTVSRHSHTCSMVAAFPRDVFLFIRFDDRRDEATLVLVDPSFVSAKEEREYSLDVTLVGRAKALSRFSERTFLSIQVGDQIGIATMFHGREFLSVIERAEGLSIMRGGSSVGHFSLSGSRKGAASLRQCAKEVAAETPSDPLE